MNVRAFTNRDRRTEHSSIESYRRYQLTSLVTPPFSSRRHDFPPRRIRQPRRRSPPLVVASFSNFSVQRLSPLAPSIPSSMPCRFCHSSTPALPPAPRRCLSRAFAVTPIIIADTSVIFTRSSSPYAHAGRATKSSLTAYRALPPIRDATLFTTATNSGQRLITRYQRRRRQFSR